MVRRHPHDDSRITSNGIFRLTDIYYHIECGACAEAQREIRGDTLNDVCVYSENLRRRHDPERIHAHPHI